MGCATAAERSATYTTTMIESLKMSATFKVSCIKSCIAPFCHYFACTALKSAIYCIFTHCISLRVDLNKRQQNEQTNKKLKRQAKQHCPCKLQVWQDVSQDVVVFSRPFTASSLSSQILQKRKTVLSFVVVDLGLAGKTFNFSLSL